jgi:hypothetical protein
MERTKKGRSDMNHFNGSDQEFIHRAQQIFVERGFEKVNGENTLNGDFMLFTRNEALHLVYYLPYEMYVTTVEIQTCWETQCRLGAHSSSVVALGRFSQAAIHKAQSLAIELLPLESSERCANTNASLHGRRWKML